jgi:hypothetical protein
MLTDEDKDELRLQAPICECQGSEWCMYCSSLFTVVLEIVAAREREAARRAWEEGMATANACDSERELMTTRNPYDGDSDAD